MDKDFFESPIVKLLFNENKYPVLHFFQQLQTANSLEKTWSDIDICSKLTNSNISIPIISMKHDHEILFNLLNRNDDEKFKNNYDCQLKWVKKDGCLGPLADWEARELIVELYKKVEPLEGNLLSILIKDLIENSNLVGIASFNYDLSLEKMWDLLCIKNRELCYFNPDNDGHILDKNIPFYKLHGSINWKSEFSAEEEKGKSWSEEITNIKSLPIESKYEKGEFFTEERNKKDYRPKKVVQAAIIPPVIFKQNINLDLQNDKRSVLFKKIWNAMWEKLVDVDTLIFIGFSFPETDYHAKILFSTAHRRKQFKRIIVNTKSAESKERYISIFDRNSISFFDEGIQNLIKRKDEFISLIN